MSDIPSDIVAEFLSRVPALSLLRFRCVSKTWRSIIDSPGLIKLHLHRTLQTESDRKIILLPGHELFWAGDLDLAENANVVHYTKLDCPFERKGPITNVIGSCHGVLCLGGMFEDEGIALWNPTTREILNLPSPEVPYILLKYCRCFGVGFGYDKVSDDYKVLMIIQRFKYRENEAIVYSMKLKSWKRIDSFPFHLLDRITNGVLASGSLHFKCCSSYPKDVADENALIGAFDLETEEYRLVPQPEFPPENGKFHMNLVALGGCLCMMCYYFDGESRSLDIWVMKNYHPVKESWTKLLTIGQPVANSGTGEGPTFGIINAKPLAYSRSAGREVFIVAHAYKRLLWYDLEKRRIRFAEFEIDYITLDTEHHLCCGTLVKLNSKGMKNRCNAPKIYPRSNIKILLI